MPTWSFILFQDASSPMMEQLMFFHDHSMIILTLITILTLYMILSPVVSSSYNKFLLEGQEIETIWTILPAFMLVFIALPSMKILYLMEESKNASMTVKATGHQWYWSYEYADSTEQDFDAFLEASQSLRLLKASETLMIPIGTPVRTLVSSMDVIHSWALPAMGVKVDANPGRMNQTMLMSKRVGLYTGQCSEICGANHSFMPILVESLTIPMIIKNIKG